MIILIAPSQASSVALLVRSYRYLTRTGGADSPTKGLIALANVLICLVKCFAPPFALVPRCSLPGTTSRLVRDQLSKHQRGGSSNRPGNETTAHLTLDADTSPYFEALPTSRYNPGEHCIYRKPSCRTAHESGLQFADVFKMLMISIGPDFNLLPWVTTVGGIALKYIEASASYISRPARLPYHWNVLPVLYRSVTQKRPKW